MSVFTKEDLEERTATIEACKGNEDMKVVISDKEIQVVVCETEKLKEEHPRTRLAIDGIPECDHLVEEGLCKAYLWPDRKWAGGKTCPLSPLAKAKILATQMIDELRINPLKMSKRGMTQK